MEQRHRRDDADAFAEFGAGLMDAVVEEVTFGGIAAVGPNAFNVNERALARAVDPVLQGGERDGFIFGLHWSNGTGRSVYVRLS